MRLGSLLVAFAAQQLLGCASGQPMVGTSVGQKAVAAEADQATAHPSAASAGSASDSKQSASDTEHPAPPDPALLKALVAKTGESAALDNPLHVRLEVLPQPAGQLWLLSVVNRGTAPASVLLDMRRLTLALEKPEDPEKPRPKWKKKPAPVLCTLPEAFGGTWRDAEGQRVHLEPGEGLIQTFDPRLYCISSQGESLLAQGLIVTPRLGFKPKAPRVVWKAGKRTEVPSLQFAPFVAIPTPDAPTAAPSKSGDAPTKQLETALEIDPTTDLRVKELSANPFLLDAEIAGTDPPADDEQPLQLRLLRGSDAQNERTATAQVEVRSTGKKAAVYFRRELLSFEVHGPEGVSGCDPQPDDRSPDRQAYSTLKPGGAVSATSLLTELCPNATFARPGLYLVSARFDAVRDGAEFGLRAFTGRLASRRQALVRVRSGELPPLPPPEPIRVKVGE